MSDYRAQTAGGIPGTPGWVRRCVWAGRRVTSRRSMGKLAFYDIVDGDTRVQLSLQADILGQDLFDMVLGEVTPGDLGGTAGLLILTKMGERSVDVSCFLTATSYKISPRSTFLSWSPCRWWSSRRSPLIALLVGLLTYLVIDLAKKRRPGPYMVGSAALLLLGAAAQMMV